MKINSMESDINNLEDPFIPYNTIRKSSFEELENQNRLYSLSLSPIQRLAYLMELNINAFGRKSLNINQLELKIYKK